MTTLYLAWAYIRFNAVKSAVLVAVAALILAAPLAIRALLDEGERQLAARAQATPLVIGARGSRLDLALNALYFSDDLPAPTTMAAAERVWDGGLAVAIPIHARFSAEGARVVGTTLDYFEFRGLMVAKGRGLATLGEAVLGAKAAERLGLGPGGALVTSPENLFDLAGVYPLKLRVAGVLAPAGGPDDEAVFVDLKTAWIIAGIGHGHEDVVSDGGAPVTARPDIVQFTEITPQNISGFHFHADPARLPLTAVIAVPYDHRSATLLRGRYLDAEGDEQIILPERVIGGLIERLFRLRALLDAVVGAVGLAAAAALGLAIYLSLQLRRGEMATAFRLGARRWTMARLAAAETAILLGLAALIAAGLAAGAGSLAGSAARLLLALGRMSGFRETLPPLLAAELAEGAAAPAPDEAVERALVAAAGARSLAGTAAAVAGLPQGAISALARGRARAALAACQAIATETSASRNAAIRALAAAGVTAVPDPSVRSSQWHEFGLRIAPRDVVSAVSAAEALGYLPQRRLSAGALEATRRLENSLLLTGRDAATTRMTLRWRDAPPRPGWPGRLKPTHDALRRVALPGPLWPLYALARPWLKLGLPLPGSAAEGPAPGGFYLGTPASLIAPLLVAAELGPGDVLADLGCGDGRVAVEAARRHGCRALGVERVPALAAAARAAVAAAGLEDRVTIVEGEMEAADLSQVAVAFLFLPMDALAAALPRTLARLPAGARIIAHEQEPLAGAPPPERSMLVLSKNAVTVAHLWRAGALSSGEQGAILDRKGKGRTSR